MWNEAQFALRLLPSEGLGEDEMELQFCWIKSLYSPTKIPSLERLDWPLNTEDGLRPDWWRRAHVFIRSADTLARESAFAMPDWVLCVPTPVVGKVMSKLEAARLLAIQRNTDDIRHNGKTVKAIDDYIGQMRDELLEIFAVKNQKRSAADAGDLDTLGGLWTRHGR
jgi:hypothetical protein